MFKYKIECEALNIAKEIEGTQLVFTNSLSTTDILPPIFSLSVNIESEDFGEINSQFLEIFNQFLEIKNREDYVSVNFYFWSTNSESFVKLFTIDELSHVQYFNDFTNHSTPDRPLIETAIVFVSKESV